MNKYEILEEKIRSMSFKEIVLAMVDSLRNPVMKIEMGSWGQKDYKGICFGCAAAHTICKIGNLNPEMEFNEMDRYREYVTNLHWYGSFIQEFEKAIDSIRVGNIAGYNNIAKRIDISVCPITIHNTRLPRLEDNFTPDELKVYEDFARLL